jgi:hypothetical protein
VKSEKSKESYLQSWPLFPYLVTFSFSLHPSIPVAFSSAPLRTGLDGPFGKTQGRLFFTDPTPLLINPALGKFPLENLNYSTLPYKASVTMKQHPRNPQAGIVSRERFNMTSNSSSGISRVATLA